MSLAGLHSRLSASLRSSRRRTRWRIGLRWGRRPFPRGSLGRVLSGPPLSIERSPTIISPPLVVDLDNVTTMR